MLILAYRSLPPETSLPIDQRWRVIELDPTAFDGIDLTSSQAISSVIHRVNESKVQFVLPFPHDADVYLLDTETADHWSMTLSVEKSS